MVAFGAIAGSVAVLIKGSQSGDSSKQHMGVVRSLAAQHLQLEHQHCVAQTSIREVSLHM